MHSIVDAARILRSAEEELRKVLAEAAANGDYEVVIALTSMAQDVSAILRRHGNLNPSPSQSEPAKSTNPPTVVARRDSYPKFFRDGDDILKIGWSKKEKEEYLHKAPRSVLLRTAESIGKLSGKQRLWTPESLMAVINSEGNGIPEYQTYLCLAFLRNAGLVIQHGRQGYSVESRDITADTQSAWKNLDGRR